MCENISSRLIPGIEIEPKALKENKRFRFLGLKIYGQGFILTPDERQDLIRKNVRNAKRIFPYIGGKEVNTSPTQDFRRYVINFGAMSLEEAGCWPDLLDIVRWKVKPERDKNKREVRRKYWWRFGEVAPALYAAIDDLPRCLVTAVVTKHLCFSFQPTDRVFAESLYVFPLPAYTHFAILQSRVHAPWVWLLSSTLRETLNYSASDCFDTFPFPNGDPRTIIASVEGAGRKLYEARARYMVQTNQGLTKTYNALKDPECQDREIIRLRRLHEAMDEAVLQAYGWDDLKVPPYEVKDEAFENEVISRLMALNRKRAP